MNHRILLVIAAFVGVLFLTPPAAQATEWVPDVQFDIDRALSKAQKFDRAGGALLAGGIGAGVGGAFGVAQLIRVGGPADDLAHSDSWGFEYIGMGINALTVLLAVAGVVGGVALITASTAAFGKAAAYRSDAAELDAERRRRRYDTSRRAAVTWGFRPA
ncbi:MAG: hypothetical protein GY898_10330 [Proteobacteria bacterium]|nr:hypothetical protein [Pseudomonadota bacterium]